MTRVVIYCPDRHIEYDGHTPERVGVGGGITARVRMAKALASLGHDVTMVVNCARERWIDGVRYIPLNQFHAFDGDIAILNTSGGDLDLSPVQNLDLNVRLRVVWVHGVDKPIGLDQLDFDRIYAVSNFIAGIVRDEWGIPGEKIFVSYNAFDKDLFTEVERQSPVRDPFQLVYFSHPSKGLNTAIEVTHRLREKDRRFHLVIYGGTQLWGQKEEGMSEEIGIEYRGLVGQHILAAGLQRSAYSMQLQHRQEPGALSIFDALRAGCVIICSSVGCYPEMIANSSNGLIISGDHRTDSAQNRTVEHILDLSRDPEKFERMSKKAQEIRWSTDVAARVWTDHWMAVLDPEARTSISKRGGCIQCGQRAFRMLDGVHCMACGYYSPKLTNPQRL